MVKQFFRTLFLMLWAAVIAFLWSVVPAAALDEVLTARSTLLAGTADSDFGTGVAVDARGNVYVVGYTSGSFASFTSNGEADAFLVKYDSSNVLLWTKQWGTAENDFAFAVGVDSEGSVYAAGSTFGSFDGFTNAGGSDPFLVKYSSAGALQWTVQFGTALNDEVFGLAVTSTGDVVAAGYTRGDLGGTGNLGGSDLFIIACSSAGGARWLRQAGSAADDIARSVTLDAAGNAYVAGSTAGNFGGTPFGGIDMFLTKYSADGIVQWTRLRGTSQDDSVFSVSAGRESACIAGSTAGALDTAYGGIDAVIASYSLDGMLLWTRQFGTAETDRATAVAVSTVGIVAAGFTAGGFAPAVNAGSSDIFVAEYDLDGNRRVLRQIGTPAPDSAQGAAVAGSGFHVAGYTGGNLNGVAGLGREDLFLMRFTTGTVPLLLWTQESGYSEGGLQPTDSAGTGTYVYRVAYRQSEGIAPLAGYPKLHVLQDGAETAGSPFTMAEVTPGATNYATGVIFTYSLTLPEGSYRYYFEAYDQFNNPAAGAPTARLEGPTYRPPEAQNIKAYHGVFKPGDGETCTLAYTLDRPGEIGVAVYDSLGGKVKDLFRNTVAAGVNTVVWDGKNTAGDLVASGVYVFRIDPGGKKLKKIVVVR